MSDTGLFDCPPLDDRNRAFWWHESRRKETTMSASRSAAAGRAPERYGARSDQIQKLTAQVLTL